MRVRGFLTASLILGLGSSLYACGSKETTGSTGFMSTTSSSSGGGAGSGGNGGEGGLFNASTTSSATSTGTGSTSTGTGSTSTGAGGMGPMCDPNPTMGPHIFSAAYADSDPNATSSKVGLAVATDAAGNVAIAGTYSGSMVIGGTTLTATGATSVFAAKFGPDGTPMWAKSFGGGNNESARGVAFDAQGNIVLVGQFFGNVNFGGAGFTSTGPNFDDVFVAKLGPQGNHLWSKTFGDKNSQLANAVAVGANGDIFVVGEFQSLLSFGAVSLTDVAAGTSDAFVAAFDSAGNTKWAKSFGDGADQAASSVAVDKNGDVLVTGFTKGAVDFGQGALPLTGTQNAWVAKLSAAGSVTWGKLYGTDKSSGVGVGADSMGNVLVTGDHEGAIDFGGGALPNLFGPNVFVAKLDSTGKHVWSKSYGDDSSQHARGLFVDAGGKVLVTGTISGSMDFGGTKLTSTGGLDIFLAKIDTVGCSVWAKDFGDPGYQSASAVAIDGMGNAFLTGNVSGAVSFGGNAVQGHNAAAFLAKFGP